MDQEDFRCHSFHLGGMLRHYRSDAAAVNPDDRILLYTQFDHNVHVSTA